VKSILAKPKNEYPGPGNYKDESKKVKGYGFGSSPRDPPKKDGGPGPGSYKIPTKISNTSKMAVPGQNQEFRYV
jgi:hypothetical protein